MARTYEKGRPTTGYRKGVKVVRPEQLKLHDRLIMVSHDFGAENLIRVTKTKVPTTGGFYYKYVLAKGEKHIMDYWRTMHAWPIDLTGGQKEFFRAVEV